MRLEIQGQPIDFAEEGPRDGLPVVLLHAFPFTREMWSAQIAALQGSFRVIAPDSRGLGATPTGDGQHTMEFLADDLLGLLAALALPPAVLAGCSMGGYVALRVMERAPERVRALVLADTKSEADTNEGLVKRAAVMRAVKGDGVADFADGFLQTALSPVTHRDHPEIVSHARNLILGNSPRGICGSLLALATRTDTTASLGQIAVPTLVLVGEDDKLTPPADAKALASRIPGARLEIIPRAGHISPMENAEAFNAAMEKFLRAL